MIVIVYTLAIGLLLFGIRFLVRRAVRMVNSSLEEGLISSGFIANTAYFLLFALIFRICVI